MGLVALAISDGERTHSFWLMDAVGRMKARCVLAGMENLTMVCFNTGAEARCFVALGLDPLAYKWVDLYLDYKQLMNKDDKYRYGWQMGKTILGRPMLKESIPLCIPANAHLGSFVLERMAANHKESMSKLGKSVEPLTANLINASITFVKGFKDKAVAAKTEKDETINMIINPRNVTFNDWQREQILTYCESDVHELKEMMENMGTALCERSKQSPAQVLTNRLWRGRVGAMMAIIESTGTPINTTIFSALRDNADRITNSAKAGFNAETGANLFSWKTSGIRSNAWKLDTFSESQEAFDTFIEKEGWSIGWPKNKNGKWSKSEANLKNKGLHPVINGLLSVRKVSKAMSSVKGTSNSVSTAQRIGSDNRLRVPLFPYGTQTARNAPPAASYIYAQGGWMKCVVDIPKGYRVAETDFSSQEFIIGGVLGKDINMIEAYKTDVYISFGFAAGQFDPKYMTVHDVIKDYKHGDKTVKAIRQKMKGIVLSLSYGAMPPSIAASTGLPLLEVEALVAKYERHYSNYYTWRRSIWAQHLRRNVPITLDIGWYLGFDNTNSLSTMNFPVQATGSSILHKSIERVLCDKRLKDAGVQIINPLHDALYYLIPESFKDAEMIVEGHMRDASEEVLGCRDMKLETSVWHHGDNIANGYPLWEQFKPLLGDSIK